MNTENNDTVVVATLVVEEHRMAFYPAHLKQFHGIGQDLVYLWMRTLCADYNGGYWDFFTLSNGGFYVAVSSDQVFEVCVTGNYFEGELSADAAGIVTTLFALNHLASKYAEDWLIDLYHHLREYALGHPERSKILAAID